MFSRNTVGESSHKSFFWGGDPFCEVVRRLENTHRDMTGSAWVTSGSLFAWETSGPFPLRLSDQRISVFGPKSQTLYCLFKSHADIWTSSSPRVFFCLWLVIGTYILPFFFPVICWSYLRTEISVTLSIGNKYSSRHHILYFSFLWKPFCWCYLATALNLLCSSMAYYRGSRLFQRVFIFTNPSARAGYDTRPIFKRNLTGLNLEFSFS